MQTTPLALLTLSFALGLRHALDVDHLAAVAAIASERTGLWSSSIVGALWGLGHSAALVAVAAVVIVLRLQIPTWTATLFELAVAVTLMGLGARLFRSLLTGAVIHVHEHEHGTRRHAHPHLHPLGAAHGGPDEHGGTDRVPHPGERAWRRPVLVGLMHGMAGSAGLMVAVLATVPSRALALTYVAIFATGAVAGMVLMSALAGVPLALASARLARLTTATRAAAALAGVAVGLALAWRIVVEHGLWA